MEGQREVGPPPPDRLQRSCPHRYLPLPPWPSLPFLPLHPYLSAYCFIIHCVSRHGACLSFMFLCFWWWWLGLSRGLCGFVCLAEVEFFWSFFSCFSTAVSLVFSRLNSKFTFPGFVACTLCFPLSPSFLSPLSPFSIFLALSFLDPTL